MRTVTVGGREIAYELSRRPRMRTIRLTVTGTGLRVSCAPGVPLREVEQAIRSKERWLLRHAALLDSSPPPPLGDGDVLPLLGGGVALAVTTGDHSAWTFQREQGRVAVQIAAGGDVDAVVEDWYRSVALRHFGALVARRARRLAVPVPSVTVRDPRSRWGSCSARGALSLSWRLVMAPFRVGEYVVVHELAHLVEMNHSPAFWAVVERELPGHRAERDWLRRHGPELLRRRPLPRRRGS